MKDFLITLLPGGKQQRFVEDTLLADALFDMGVNLKTPCGGKGTCAKCRVKVQGRLSEPTAMEIRLGTLGDGHRLACQARLQGDVSVELDAEGSTANRVYPEMDRSSAYAIGVDIGTTTVKISLVDLRLGQSYMLESFLNPQRRYGHDVINRIAVSDDQTTYNALVGMIREKIFGSILQALEAMHIAPERVENITFSGNTTMLYFVFALDVAPLGLYPYHAGTVDFDTFSARDLGFEQFSRAKISALPAVSAFLGGDLMGGLAFCYEQGLNKNTFFIDMGTNGELYLINSSGEIYATSCAMGPALEGMNISWGMTADNGAITHIWSEQEIFEYHMINNGTPVGITGTALIDIIAELLDRNVILATGAFLRDHDTMLLPEPARFDNRGAVKQITLWNDIALTQKDIRSVQLAKGASLAASRFLLMEAGCAPEDIEQVIIAGAFGEHMDLENFKRLSFLAPFPNAQYHFLGNTSLKSAEKVCMDSSFLVMASELRDRVKEVELSMNPAFNDEFINSMNF